MQSNKQNPCKLNIFTSQYLGKQISYSFNSTKTDDFNFNYFSCQMPTPKNMTLYFYQQPIPPNSTNSTLPTKSKILISITMDYHNYYNLIFKLDIIETKQAIIFKFMDLAQVIIQNQGKLYSEEHLKKRLEVIHDHNGDEKINKYSKVNLLNGKQIQTYFYPQMRKCSKIWFVPRFMNDVQIEKQMQIRFYYQKFIQQNYQYKDLIITQLQTQYIIQQTSLQKILVQQQKYQDQQANQPQNQNSLNIFHMCSIISQQIIKKSNKGKNNEFQCYICHQQQQDSIDKEHPNLLVDLCNCHGTVHFVHIKCITFWIISQNRQDIIRCMQCKKVYPKFIQVPRVNRKGEIVFRYFKLIDNIITPFIIIQDLKCQMFSNQEIMLGSAQKCNYQFLGKEQKVYSSINYNPSRQKAYIKDLKTDFGTLINKKNMSIKLNKSKNLQLTCTVLVNKTLFNITISQQHQNTD